VLARLAVRLGEGAAFAAEPVERYRPEGAYRPVPFQAPSRRSAAARPALPIVAGPARAAGGGARATAGPEWPGADAASRPTRLLAAPAPVVAEGEGGRLTALRAGGRSRAVLAMEGP
jgi:protein ImuB